MHQAYVTDWAQLVEGCRLRALQAWRSDYARHIAVDDLLGNHVRRITVASNEHPHGIVEVMVRIRARAAHGHETYFWKAKRVAGQYYLL